MALNEEFYDKIVAKIVKEGEADDLAKFVLSGNEALAAAKWYFYNLEADEKRKLILEDDTWFVGFIDDVFDYEIKKHTGFSLFKIFASSIIPFIEKLEIINTHLKDYSFLKDIKHLNQLYLKFKDQEYVEVLSGLSSLQSVDELSLNIKNLNLQVCQFLSSLAFSFDFLLARNFTFEVDPQCSKVFQTPNVCLLGDEELQNDFVFTRENYQNYAAIFPNAARLRFVFFVKIVDDLSDLLKVSNASHAAEVNVNNRNIQFEYRFYDYSGFPESKVLKLLQDDEDWNTVFCPYMCAYNYMAEKVYCSFPLAIDDVRKSIANNTLRRIPEGSDGNPDDYYRLIIVIDIDDQLEAELKVLKTVSVESLLEAVREITGIHDNRFGFEYYSRSISNGTVADNFDDEDTIVFCPPIN